MAEISVFRGYVSVNGEPAGEVYSFTPLEDCEYNLTIGFTPMSGGLLPPSMTLRCNTEIKITVPDELFFAPMKGHPAIVSQKPGIPDPHYTAWGLVLEARKGTLGFKLPD